MPVLRVVEFRAPKRQCRQQRSAVDVAIRLCLAVAVVVVVADDCDFVAGVLERLQRAQDLHQLVHDARGRRRLVVLDVAGAAGGGGAHQMAQQLEQFGHAHDGQRPLRHERRRVARQHERLEVRTAAQHQKRFRPLVHLLLLVF